jgi:hypothetical protein
MNNTNIKYVSTYTICVMHLALCYRTEDSHTATCSRGDLRIFFTDAGYTLHGREAQCSVLSSGDSVQLVLEDAEEEQDVWHTLKENSYRILHGEKKENEEERQSTEACKETEEMVEAENEVSEEKEKDENGQTLSLLQDSELKGKEPPATEGRPLDTNVEQVSHCTVH